MKRKAILSLMLVAVLMIGASLGTYAWFSSTATSQANTFKSGTLKLKVNDGLNNFNLPLGEIGNIAPGGQLEPVEIIIENNGTLDLAWFGYFDIYGQKDLAKALYVKEAQMDFISETGNSWTEPTDKFITNGKPSGKYEVYLQHLVDNSVDEKVVTLHSWMNNDLGMGAGKGVQMGALKDGFKYKFTIQLGMLESAGNEYQNMTMGLKYVVDSTQVNLKAIESIKGENSPMTYPTNYADAINFFTGQLNNQVVGN